MRRLVGNSNLKHLNQRIRYFMVLELNGQDFNEYKIVFVFFYKYMLKNVRNGFFI